MRKRVLGLFQPSNFCHLLLIFVIGVVLASCGARQQALKDRAGELCRYLPDVDKLELSKTALTEEFYSALEAMIAIPDSTEVLHEWEFWFVAADGSLVAKDSCSVLAAERQGCRRAIARIMVIPEDSDYPAEEHVLSLERLRGIWLISDYDGTKEQAKRRIAIFGGFND